MFNRCPVCGETLHTSLLRNDGICHACGGEVWPDIKNFRDYITPMPNGRYAVLATMSPLIVIGDENGDVSVTYSLWRGEKGALPSLDVRRVPCVSLPQEVRHPYGYPVRMRDYRWPLLAGKREDRFLHYWEMRVIAGMGTFSNGAQVWFVMDCRTVIVNKTMDDILTPRLLIHLKQRELSLN